MVCFLLESGVLAARSIITGQKYENLLFRLKQDMQHSLVLRNLFNKAQNDDYDRILKFIAVPGLKHLVYNTNIDVLRIGTVAIDSYKNIVDRLRGLKR